MYQTIKKQLWELLRDITSIGGFMFYLSLLLVYAHSILFLPLLFGLIFTASIVVLIRIFYFKDRPKKEAHHNLIERIDASSFPSLHTARIVFLAALFSAHYESSYLTGVFIISAIAVSYSRIYLQKHDYIDVFAGAVLGGIAFMIASYLF